MSILQIQKDIKAMFYLIRNCGFGKGFKALQLGRRPIIIGGCGRSGTTLLLSLLSCHPHFYAISQETRAYSQYGDEYYPDRNSLFRLKKIYEYMLENDISTECLRWCEKTPRNVLYYRRILDYYGKRVRIINIVRDGRNVILSTHPTNPKKHWVTPERWVLNVTSGKQFESHPQVCTIRYEDLVADLPTTMKAIYSFLDESFCEELLDYPKCANVQTNAAWFGGARPVSNSGLGRWQEPQHEERVATLLSDPRAVELLEHYGYIGSV